jgi:predicted nucleotidyltransferase
VWTLLGTFQLDPGQNHRVEIADQASGGTYVVADVVAFERVEAPPATATWTPALTQADLFDVYGRWPVDASAFSSNVQYTVVHQGGSAATTVSQKTG